MNHTVSILAILFELMLVPASALHPQRLDRHLMQQAETDRSFAEATCDPGGMIFLDEQIPIVPLEAGTQEKLLKEKISSGLFARLYSNTFYDLVGRIEEDGYLRESHDADKGYDGMYPRTIGATVSLLLAVDQPEPAERLVRCVLNAMKDNGMERIPHAFDKLRSGSASHAGKYFILGRGDQLDGQAHVIMAWARLANYRGRTLFEDRTFPDIATLLNNSLQPPYWNDTTNGKLSGLMFNPYLEHSRRPPLKWRYDLLTQFFVGAALSEMITVAERRNDPSNANLWKEGLRRLTEAIARHFVVRRDGKEVFAELLLADSNQVFDGMGWLTMAPIAAQWNPFGNVVMRNSLEYMYHHLSKERDGHAWLPVDSWPGGGFSPQIIGKGVAWEIEFASREKRYQKVSEIVDLIEYLHPNSRLYMEHASLCDDDNRDVPLLTSDRVSSYRNGLWRLADPGNGEQVSWWCWAVANLRKRLGLSGVPERVVPDPRPEGSRRAPTELSFVEEPGTKIYYTLDGTIPSERSLHYSGGIHITLPARVNVVATRDGMIPSTVLGYDFLTPENGLEYTFSGGEANAPESPHGPVVMRRGAIKEVGCPLPPVHRTRNVLKCDGFIDIKHSGDYVFRIRSLAEAHLLIDGAAAATTSDASGERTLRLEKGFHAFSYEARDIRENSRIDVSYSWNGSQYVSIRPQLLFQREPSGTFVEMPEILPDQSEFDDGSPLKIVIECPTEGSRISYTLDGVDATDSSPVYTAPFAIAEPVTVKAIARTDAGNHSSQAVMKYVPIPRGVKISLTPEPSPRYATHGASTLIDGIRGTMDISENTWLGFQGTDCEAELDFGEKKHISGITVGFLHDPDKWIFLPKKLHLCISDNRGNAREIFTLDVTPHDLQKAEIRYATLSPEAFDCRYLILRAENFGVCPAWHSAAGGKTWLFVDEIEIR
jgi:hypothetical protein